jgi:hypothetical protein
VHLCEVQLNRRYDGRHSNAWLGVLEQVGRESFTAVRASRRTALGDGHSTRSAKLFNYIVEFHFCHKAIGVTGGRW